MSGLLQLILVMSTLVLVVVGLLVFAWREACRSGRRMKEKVHHLQANGSRIIQTEKMATVGQVAAGVAHEINNPVGFIMSNLFTLQEYFDFQNRLTTALLDLARSGQDDPIRQRELHARVDELLGEDDPDFIREDGFKLIHESLDGATRVKEIVLNLMAMAKLDSAERTACDLNESIRSVAAILDGHPEHKERLRLELPALPPVLGRPNQLNLALFHLLQNALEHSPPGSPVSISSDCEQGPVRIRIADEGPGIPEADRERVFDPFFTTKSAGQGAGLGLSLARDILVRHGGSLVLESGPGPGACFCIILPPASADTGQEKPAPRQEEPVFQVQDRGPATPSASPPSFSG